MGFSTIKKGKILIAEPFMIDPNFKRSVVLMCEHEEEGSLGFILNKSLDMKVNELIADFPEIESTVYYGGPVQTDTIHYIHNVGEVLDESLKVMNDRLKKLMELKLLLVGVVIMISMKNGTELWYHQLSEVLRFFQIKEK